MSGGNAHLTQFLAQVGIACPAHSSPSTKQTVKKSGFIVLFVAVGVVAGGLAAASYYWTQATGVPAWHGTETAITDFADPSLVDARSRVIDQIVVSRNADNTSNVEAEFSETEINQLVAGTLADIPNARPLLRGARSVNTVIQNGMLESGMVVDLSDIPAESLGSQERAALEQIRNTLPAIANREIYIGIESRPRAENGQVRFGEDTRVKIGNLSLSLSEVSDYVGISPAQLEQSLNQELERRGISIEDIDLAGDRARISGSAP